MFLPVGFLAVRAVAEPNSQTGSVLLSLPAAAFFSMAVTQPGLQSAGRKVGSRCTATPAIHTEQTHGLRQPTRKEGPLYIPAPHSTCIPCMCFCACPYCTTMLTTLWHQTVCTQAQSKAQRFHTPLLPCHQTLTTVWQ